MRISSFHYILMIKAHKNSGITYSFSFFLNSQYFHLFDCLLHCIAYFIVLHTFPILWHISNVDVIATKREMIFSKEKFLIQTCFFLCVEWDDHLWVDIGWNHWEWEQPAHKILPFFVCIFVFRNIHWVDIGRNHWERRSRKIFAHLCVWPPRD